MKATSRGETVEIRNPAATRPWQHVLECLSGYLSVGQRLLEGRKEFATAFNFGPGPEGALSVGEVAKKVKQWWPAMRFETPPQKGAPHEARFLQLDCARAFSMLGWRPTWDLDDALKTTVEWYKDFYTQGKARTGDDIAQFVRAARKKDAVWTRKTT
jgi:CDP-glucose 4,6-dehydratase